MLPETAVLTGSLYEYSMNTGASSPESSIVPALAVDTDVAARTSPANQASATV